MYTSYFTSVVTLEVKAERSLEMGVEQSSNLKSGVEQSSDLEVGWNLEQQKCEMGHCKISYILLLVDIYAQHIYLCFI